MFIINQLKLIVIDVDTRDLIKKREEVKEKFLITS